MCHWAVLPEKRCRNGPWWHRQAPRPRGTARCSVRGCVCWPPPAPGLPWRETVRCTGSCQAGAIAVSCGLEQRFCSYRRRCESGARNAPAGSCLALLCGPAARAACRAWRRSAHSHAWRGGVRRRGPRSWSRGSSTGLLGLPHRMAARLPARVTGAGQGLRGLSLLSLGCHLIQASRCGTQTRMPGSQEGAPLGFSTQPPAIRATCPSWRCPAGAGARCVPSMSLRGCFRAHKTTVVL